MVQKELGESCRFSSHISQINPRHLVTELSDPHRVVATIAEKAGVLDDTFTKEAFLADLHDWESAVKPAYTEHKVALGYGVTCRCRNQRRVDGVDAVDRTHRFMARRSTSSTANSSPTRSPRGARPTGRRS